MAAPETNTRKTIRRLACEGWVHTGGGQHDVFRHPDGRKIMVPRHRTQSIGVARDTAKKAGGREAAGMSYYVAVLDGGKSVWGVRLPDFPGCYGGGATPEAAIADATSALREFAAMMVADGETIPRARTLDELEPDERPGREEYLVLIPLRLSGRPPQRVLSRLLCGSFQLPLTQSSSWQSERDLVRDAGRS